MATTYSVVLALSTTGSLDAKLENVGRKAHGAGEMVRGLGEKIKSIGEVAGGYIEGVVDKIFSLGETAAKIGGAAAFGAITYGVVGLNNQLEQTQISLAAIAHAQGFSSDFQGGMQIAAKQLRAMKQDIKTLPGDLGQLSSIVKTIATPAAQAGASMDEIRKLAGRTMLTGAILSVPTEVAQREMANLLAGRAGAHNILGTRLGLVGEEARKFNALSPELRLARINEELNKYSGAADRFGQSFIAQVTTLKDNLKYSVLAEMTAPLFERVKSALVGINEWFDHNTDRVKAFAKMVGEDLVKAWDAVTSRLVKLEPLFDKMVAGMGHLTAAKVEGFAAKVGLGLVGAKVAGPAISGVGSLVGGGLNLAGGLMKVAPMLGGMGPALEALANPVTIGAVVVGLQLLAGAAVAVVGAIHALTDETSTFHAFAISLWKDITTQLGDAFIQVKSAASELIAAVTPLVDILGVELLVVIRALVPLAGLLASALVDVAHGFSIVMQTISRLPGFSALGQGTAIMGPGLSGSSVREAQANAAFGDHVGKLREGIEGGVEAAAKRGAGGGGGGTHVQKVEIVVNSNQDPSRIARMTFVEWSKWARNPTRSPHVPIYSAPDR